MGTLTIRAKRRETKPFGAQLRALREQANLSLRQAEERSGVSNGYISLVEHDRVKEPSPHALHALARCYGADYWQLMRIVGYPTPERVGSVPEPDFAFRGAERLTPEDQEEIRALIRLKLRRLRGS